MWWFCNIGKSANTPSKIGVELYKILHVCDYLGSWTVQHNLNFLFASEIHSSFLVCQWKLYVFCPAFFKKIKFQMGNCKLILNYL